MLSDSARSYAQAVSACSFGAELSGRGLQNPILVLFFPCPAPEFRNGSSALAEPRERGAAVHSR